MNDYRASQLARHEAFLERLRSLSADEAFEIAVAAGIYTEDGQLTPPYRQEAVPSPSAAPTGK